MDTATETLPNGTRVFTTPAHRFGTDAMLLARFCAPKRAWACCDLGSGSGVLALSLWDAGVRGPITGIELDREGAMLLQRACAANGIGSVSAIHGDVRGYTENRCYDLVVSNPPYFTSGLLPPDERRAAARHQQNGGIGDFAATAARLLKDRGRFAVCYPANGMATLFAAMAANGIEPKRLRLVRKTAGDAPWLALVEGRRAGRPGLVIEPDVLVPPGQPVHF